MHIDRKVARRAVDFAYDYGLVCHVSEFMLEWHRHATGERACISNDAYQCAQNVFKAVQEKMEGKETDPCKTLLTLCPSLRER